MARKIFTSGRKALVLLPAFLFLALANAQSGDAESCPCCAESYRQFAFWVGQWQVHAPARPDSLLGQNQIDILYDGCVLQEKWESAAGPYTGTSYNWYDRGADVWQQIWIDKQGSRLHLRGGFKKGSMVLESLPGRPGPTQRITWTSRPDGSVRQHWQQSEDGGKAWQTLFDGIYVRGQ